MTGLAVAGLVAPHPACGQVVAYNGSLLFATGDYIFSERTQTLFLFNGVTGSMGRFRVSASVPVILQSTPWVSYAGGGMIPSGGMEGSEVNRQMRGHGGRQGSVVLADTVAYESLGIGDPLLGAGLELVRGGPVAPSVTLSVQAKVPLADVDRGFGTGEWDYGGGLALARPIAAALVLVDLTYWWMGDLPELELKDALGYSLAVGWSLGRGRYGLLASYSGYTEIVEGSDPPAQLGLGLSVLLGDGKSLVGNAALGLTSSAPDVSLSIGWRLPL